MADLEGVDALEQDFEQLLAKEKENQRIGLWRWLLSQPKGREFLWEIVFVELGFMRHIDGSPDQVAADVALHNLACRWLGRDVFVHRELYLQMQAEGLKRQDDERKRLEAKRLEWQQQRDAEGEES